MAITLRSMNVSRLWLKLRPPRPVTFSYMRGLHLTYTRRARSSLFVSDQHGGSEFEFENDFLHRIQEKDKLKRSVTLRGCNIDIDKLAMEYNNLQDLQTRKANLEKQRVAVAQKMAQLVKHKTKTKQTSEETNLKKGLIEKGKKLKEDYKHLMSEFWELEERVMLTTLSLPTDLLDNVTYEDEILEEAYQDNKRVLDISHVDFISRCKNIKLSPVGDRAYYLSGPLVNLEHTLLDKFSKELRQCGFTTILAPEMMKAPIVEGGCVDLTSPESVYRLLHKQTKQEVTDWNQDHMFLTGASHLSFLAYFAKATIGIDQLPWKLFVVGRSYCPGNSLPGLYGATQTNKVHVCGISGSSEGSMDLQEEFISQLLHIYKDFKLPYRLVSRSAPSLLGMEQNRLELQLWAPGLRQYIMVASVSVCGDYSGRRLMIHSSSSDNESSSAPVYMVHGQFADITRLITILLESDQVD